MTQSSEVAAQSSSAGAQSSEAASDAAAGAARRTETLFGVPVGELGWFAGLLMAVATGFVAFFAGTFLGIVGIGIYNSVAHGTGHTPADYALSYLAVGLPAGLVVLAVALGYLGTLWVKRIFRRA